MVKSLPALHDIAAMAGVEMPKYLGEIKENSSAENVSSTVEKNQ